MKNIFKLLAINLSLFDGGAAAASGAAAGAATGEGSGDAAVNSGVSNARTSVTGKRSKQGAEPVVKYGIQDVSTPEGNETTQDASEGKAKPSTITTSDTLDARKAAFEQMLQSPEYKDLFTERMQSVIDKRFKETKILEAKDKSLQPVLEILGNKYGVSDGDIEKIAQAIQEDDSYFEEEAMEKGLTVEQLKQYKKLERENSELMKAQNETIQRKQQEERYNGWLQQSEQMKAVYPGFDLNTEAQNPNFVKLLRAGVDVKAAYQAVHMDVILGGAMKHTAEEIAKSTVNSIRAKGQRPAENGLNSQPGVVVKSDVYSYTREDRKKAIAQARRGETVRF